MLSPNATPYLGERHPVQAHALLKVLVSQHIRDSIFNGTLSRGQRLDQGAIADALGVSKLPVREALIGLEGEGLVEILPRRGAYVAKMTRDDIRDHYEIFANISGMAAERAMHGLSSEQLSTLEEIHEAMADNPDMEQLRLLNEQFHRIVNSAGTSRRLRAVLRYLGETIPGHAYELSAEWRQAAHLHHGEILKALRDREGAGQSMARHISAGGTYAVRILEDIGFFSEPTETRI